MRCALSYSAGVRRAAVPLRIAQSEQSSSQQRRAGGAAAMMAARSSVVAVTLRGFGFVTFVILSWSRGAPNSSQR